MKKLILFPAIALTVLSGCKSGAGDPESVLMSFMEALGKQDINTAKKYATKDSEAMLSMMEMAMKMAPDSIGDNSFNKDKMEFSDATITGDKATVPVKDKTSGETTVFTLKKEGSYWKVAFDKATMTQMGKDKVKDMNNMDMNKNDSTEDNMNDDMNKMQNDSMNPMNQTDTI